MATVGMPETVSLDISSLNRVPAHTRWRAYENEQQALLLERVAMESDTSPDESMSPYVRSLNGVYQFRLYNHPDEPGNFHHPDNPREGFSDIPVPGNWELYGHGEPIYTNVPYPWDYNGTGDHLIKPNAGSSQIPNPPHTPSDNPTGCYYTEFTVPDTFIGREVFLRFDGVEAAYRLWVNGVFIGYAEDSKLPSEFNITKHSKPGVNSMALQVVRWGKSVYLEDQDYWHLSGIHRDVWLISKPRLCIDDYKITALPDRHSTGGSFSADVFISRVEGFADCTARVSLYTTDGVCVAAADAPVNATAEYTTRTTCTANAARVVFSLPSVHTWSPEAPVLYTAVITLLDKTGEVFDTEACPVGFKRVEIQNGIVRLNGKRLVVYGVNRHQHHYKTGRFVSKEWMIKEIIEMKRMNINAVRTCHYPDSPLWYDLCDQYGILLVCECNIETHGLAGQLTHNPSWAGLFLERAVRMAQFYKNHASIFAWSLGNESGTGANHAAMAGYLREYDPTRLCQYEAGSPGKNISDIRGNMYAPIADIMSMLTDTEDDRPVILVEYLYQIRNSGGGIYHFPELTEKYARFQGGFIWDWSDKCLLQRDDNGNEFFAYGGDFGESVIEPECPPFMTNNGIILPDLRWKPVAYEVKQAYAPIVIRPAETLHQWWVSGKPSGRYIIRNKCFNRTIDAFTIQAVLREDGHIVNTYTIAPGEINPLTEKNITYAPDYSYKNECEYFIDFTVTQKEATFYAEAGYELAHFQYLLRSALVRPEAVAELSTQGMLDVIETGVDISLCAGTFTVRVDKRTGCLSELRRDGVDYLLSAGKPCMDRPFTGMDAQPGWGWYAMFEPLRNGHITINVETVETFLSTARNRGSVHVRYRLATEVDDHTIIFHAENRYTVSAAGVVEVDMLLDVNGDLSFIPRAGLEMTLPAGFEQLTYYGYGENENYSDRLLSARMGVFTTTVTAQHFPFVPPSETGGHEQTRWLTLTNAESRTLCVKGAQPFHFDARHNTVEDYQKATHDHELIRRPETVLHIDAAHAGIGSDMAWSTGASLSHCVKAGTYRLRFDIIPG